MKYIYSVYSFIISFILNIYTFAHVIIESSADELIEFVFSFNTGVQILFGFFTLCSKTAMLQKMSVISRLYILYIYEYAIDKVCMVNYMVYLILSWSLTDAVYFGYHISNSRFQKYNMKNNNILNKIKSRLYITFYETSFPIQTSVEIYMILSSTYEWKIILPLVVIHCLYCATYYITKNSKQLKKNITEALLNIQDESYISSKYIMNNVTNIYWNDMKYEIKMNVKQIGDHLHNCCSRSRQEWLELYQYNYRLKDKGFQLREKKATIIIYTLMLISLKLCNKYMLTLHLLYNKLLYAYIADSFRNISLNIFIYKMSLSYFHILLCMEYDIFDMNTYIMFYIMSAVFIVPKKIKGSHHIMNASITALAYYNTLSHRILSCFILSIISICAQNSKWNTLNKLIS